MPVKVLRLDFNNLHGLVHAIHQPVARNRSVIPSPPRGIKPPVFGNAKIGVALPLSRDIIVGRPDRRHFQHEVRRLAQVPDGVAVLIHSLCPVYIEAHK